MSNNITGDLSVALPNTLDNENIIESSLTGYLPTDGSGVMLGDLNMNGHSIINLDTPVNPLDGVNKDYVDTSLSNYVDLTSFQIINGGKIFYDGVQDGAVGIARVDNTRSALVAFYNYLVGVKWGIGIYNGGDNLIFQKDNTTPIITLNYTTPSLSMNNYKIINCLDPTNAQDVATKNYIDNNFVTLTTNQTISGIKTFEKAGGSEIIINTTSNKNTNLIKHNVTGTTYWTTGIYSTALNTNYDYRIRKDGTTDIITIDYTSPSLNMNNYKIINCQDPTNAQDVTTKNYVDNHSFYVTVAKTGSFTYNDEDVIELSMIANTTITFDNLGSYYSGKRFELLVNNWGVGSNNITFSIINGGSYPDGTTSKTYTLIASTKKRYNCVIENITNDWLFISDMTYL